MNLFNVFFPHITYILGALFVFFIFIFPVSLLGGVISVFIFHREARKRDKQVDPSTILGFSKDGMMKFFSFLFILIILFAYTWGFLFFADGWLRIKPGKNWENDIKTIDTAIILGFGYEEDQLGRMKPGKSNEFLLEWTLNNTQAGTILVQEGVWAAVEKDFPISKNILKKSSEPKGENIYRTGKNDNQKEKWGRRFFRIHRDDKEVYVNTLQASYCAIQLLEDLGKTKAIIIAHDLQLERAVWDFQKIKSSKPNWKSFEFFYPKIPDTPFPENSAQLHTRSSFFYKLVELFISRVRDYLSSAPEACILPAHYTIKKQK